MKKNVLFGIFMVIFGQFVVATTKLETYTLPSGQKIQLNTNQTWKYLPKKIIQATEIKTQNGRKILLHKDGTWRYLKPKVNLVFKDISFGSTPAHLKYVYKKKVKEINYLEKSDLYYFDYNFGNLPALLGFYYKNGKFYKGQALITLKDDSMVNYVKEYIRIRNLLKGMYGEYKEIDKFTISWDLDKGSVTWMLAKASNKLILKAIYEWKGEKAKVDRIGGQRTKDKRQKTKGKKVAQPEPEIKIDESKDKLDIMKDLIKNMDE